MQSAEVHCRRQDGVTSSILVPSRCFTFFCLYRMVNETHNHLFSCQQAYLLWGIACNGGRWRSVEVCTNGMVLEFFCFSFMEAPKVAALLQIASILTLAVVIRA